MSVANYSTPTLALDVAGRELLDGPWELLRVIEAVDSSGEVDAGVKIRVRVGSEAEDMIPLRHGDGVLVRGGARVFVVEWDAQAGKSVTIGLSADANQVDWDISPKATLTTISGTVTVAETKATIVGASGDVTRATGGHDEIAANSTRRELFVQADADNTGPLYLRNAAGNAFARLEPGEAMVISTTALVQVRNDSGASQVYRSAEVID